MVGPGIPLYGPHRHGLVDASPLLFPGKGGPVKGKHNVTTQEKLFRVKTRIQDGVRERRQGLHMLNHQCVIIK